MKNKTIIFWYCNFLIFSYYGLTEEFDLFKEVDVKDHVFFLIKPSMMINFIFFKLCLF
jgi:hypothetical protein